MKIDSLITTEVLKISTEVRVPILSVHDSYIISFYDVELLLELMRKATQQVVGSVLAVEQEALSYDDIVELKAPDRIAGQDNFSDLYKEASALHNKTHQYDERLTRFIQYRIDNYQDTYWLPPSNHY